MPRRRGRSNQRRRSLTHSGLKEESGGLPVQTKGSRLSADVVTSVLGRDNSWDALVAGVALSPSLFRARLGGDGVGLPKCDGRMTEIGGHGTASPALATLDLGLLPLVDLASDEQQDRFSWPVWPRGSCSRAALNEPGEALPERPSTAFACREAASGTKIGVLRGTQRIGSSSRPPMASSWCRPKADGVTLPKTPTSNHGDEYAVTFADVDVPEADVLAGAPPHRVNQLVLAATGAFASEPS